MMIMITRLPAEYPAGGDASVCAQSHLARGGARLVREEDDDGDKGSCTYYVITDGRGVSPNDYSIT